MNKQITGFIPAFTQNRELEEVFIFGKNSFKAYPKSNVTFNLLPHLELNKEQKCIIDNP